VSYYSDILIDRTYMK